MLYNIFYNKKANIINIFWYKLKTQRNKKVFQRKRSIFPQSTWNVFEILKLGTHGKNNTS